MQSYNAAGPWRAMAAYLYIAHLDGPGLAWEYLRRHPEYRRDWRARHSSSAGDLTRWGLMQWEDPAQNVRCAHPVWMPQWLPTPCIVVAEGTAMSQGRALCLWDIPGRKALIATGKGFVLQVRQGQRRLHARLDAGALAGRPCACIAPFDLQERAQWRELHALMLSLAGQDARSSDALRSRLRADRAKAYRAATLHLRAIQALDGLHAGASQRQIGEALFGVRAVREHWHADSLLRARVRHTLLRGQFFMRGGYRQLLGLRHA